MEGKNGTESQPLIGCETWKGLDQWDEEGQFYQQTKQFLSTIEWGELASLCSTLRGGMACHVGDKFSMGQSNLAKQVIFEDGTCWLARLRMPENGLVFGRKESSTREATLEIEASTMRFFR